MVATGRAAVETIRVDGLELGLLDLRTGTERRPADLGPVVKESLGRLSRAKGGFGELVTSHLELIVAARLPRARILHQHRAYVCRFDGDESRDGHYLACLLIWAAVSSRLARDHEAHRQTPDRAGIRAAAQDAQLRFLKQFPDWEDWAEALRLPH